MFLGDALFAWKSKKEAIKGFFMLKFEFFFFWYTLHTFITIKLHLM